MSGVRRSASSSSSSSQLQQLQMQLQLASTQQAHARLEHGLSRVNATRNPTDLTQKMASAIKDSDSELRQRNVGSVVSIATLNRIPLLTNIKNPDIIS